VVWKYKNENMFGIMKSIQSRVYIDTLGLSTTDERLELRGTEGILWVNECAGGLALTPKPAPLVMYKEDFTIHYENVEGSRESICGFKDSSRDFVECILEDKRPKAVGEDGKKVLQFVLAAYKSTSEGKPVAPDSIGYEYRLY